MADSTFEPTRVIVLDTNAFREGRLNRRGLSQVKTLTELGVRVVVPDVVCFELAKHVIESLEQVDIDVLESANLATASVLEQIRSDEEAAVEGVRKALRGVGAILLESDVSWWKEGVIEQVRSTGAAIKKGTVKTGAPDAIVARHYLRQRSLYQATTLVTGDKVLTAYVNAAGGQVAAGLVEAQALVLENADRALTLKLLRSAFCDESWRERFAGLLAGINDFEDIVVLGVSSLVGKDANLRGTVVYRASEIQSDVENGVRNVTPWIWEAEVTFNAVTLKPEAMLFISQLDMAYGFYHPSEEYAMPLTDWIQTELSCLPNPQCPRRVHEAPTFGASFGPDSVRIEVDGALVTTVTPSDSRGEVGLTCSGALEGEEFRTPGDLGRRLASWWCDSSFSNMSA